MKHQFTRRAAVAGSWYSSNADDLEREVDGYLSEAADPPAGELVALIAPHAGLMYSGPVAAYAYRAVQNQSFDVVVLAGPSHFVAFDGVAAIEGGVFESPLGSFPVDSTLASALVAESPIIRFDPIPHLREHSLEMQFPFLGRLLPGTPIVPLVMGMQTRQTIDGLASALVAALRGRRALLVGSTDLSHYFDRETAARLDGRVVQLVTRFDVEGLLLEFERYPEHDRGRFVACGGGPAIAVAKAARALGATEARVLRYADSADVSGDTSAVVGYMAAVFGRFDIQ